MIAPWCNGSTEASDAFNSGSNPDGVSILREEHEIKNIKGGELKSGSICYYDKTRLSEFFHILRWILILITTFSIMSFVGFVFLIQCLIGKVICYAKSKTKRTKDSRSNILS